MQFNRILQLGYTPKSVLWITPMKQVFSIRGLRMIIFLKCIKSALCVFCMFEKCAFVFISFFSRFCHFRHKYVEQKKRFVIKKSIVVRE